MREPSNTGLLRVSVSGRSSGLRARRTDVDHSKQQNNGQWKTTNLHEVSRPCFRGSKRPFTIQSNARFDAMTLLVEPKTMSIDEFVALPDSAGFELVDGVLTERKTMGALSDLVAMLI